jgi:uncharacterized membrane protein (Fun14 family)
VDDIRVALGLGILGYLAGWVLGRLARTAFRGLMLVALVWLALVCLGFSLQSPAWEHLWAGVSAAGQRAQPAVRTLERTVLAHLPLALGLLLGLLRGIRARRR